MNKTIITLNVKKEDIRNNICILNLPNKINSKWENNLYVELFNASQKEVNEHVKDFINGNISNPTKGTHLPYITIIKVENEPLYGIAMTEDLPKNIEKSKTIKTTLTTTNSESIHYEYVKE